VPGSAAYADVLRGLLDLHRSEATQGFDALLGELVAAGRITADEAAAVRTWQREAMRAQADHLITTAAASLAAVEAVRDDTLAAREGVHAALGDGEAPDGDLALMLPDPAPLVGAGHGRRRRGRHAAPAGEATPAVTVLTPAQPPTPLAQDDEPQSHDAWAAPAAPDEPPITVSDDDAATRSDNPSARRRRLLVAGLTVIGDPHGTAAG